MYVVNRNMGMIIIILCFLFADILSASDLCRELSTLSSEINSVEAEDSENEDIKKSFFKRLLEIMSMGYERPGQIDNEVAFTYGVTIDSGNSIIPSCEGGVQTSVYYPIGIQVKIIGKMDLPRDGELKIHYYVIADHGLKMFIPAEHVTEILEDKAYYFQDGMGHHYYCLRDENCNRVNGTASQPSLHPDYGYAIRDLTPAHLVRIDKYLKLKDLLNKYERLNEQETQEIEASTQAVSSPFRVSHYTDGGAIGYESAYLSLGIPTASQPDDDSGTMRIGTVKVVTLAKAKEHFSKGIQGSFTRVSTSYNSVINQMIKKLAVGIVVTKDCYTESLSEDSFTLSGSLNGGASLNLGAGITKVAKLGLDGEITRGHTNTVKVQQGKGQYFVLSSYSMTPIPKLMMHEDWNQLKQNQVMFEIKSLSTCENGIPVKAASLTFYHDELAQDHSVFNAQSHFINNYFRDYGQFGYAANQEPDCLQMGMFWNIKGSEQYFLWRDLFRTQLNESPKWSNLFKNIPKDKQEGFKSLFVHLILASSFRFVD